MLASENMKTIVVDLDRTLLHSDKSLSSYTIGVLKECKKRGMQVMVATARPLRDALPFCEKFPFDAITAANGARVVCGETCVEYGMCQTSAERILRVLQCRPDLRITVETGVCAYSNEPIAEYETTLSDDLMGIVQTEGTVKILVHLDREDMLETVQNALTEDVYATVANGYLMQIMSKATTKWNGIKKMLEICGGSPAETIYFGDDNDDLEPIERCGIGVAVANGIEAVKAAADCIAESNEEDGVAKFLAQLIG